MKNNIFFCFITLFVVGLNFSQEQETLSKNSNLNKYFLNNNECIEIYEEGISSGINIISYTVKNENGYINIIHSPMLSNSIFMQVIIKNYNEYSIFSMDKIFKSTEIEKKLNNFIHSVSISEKLKLDKNTKYIGIKKFENNNFNLYQNDNIQFYFSIDTDQLNSIVLNQNNKISKYDYLDFDNKNGINYYNKSIVLYDNLQIDFKTKKFIKNNLDNIKIDFADNKKIVFNNNKFSVIEYDNNKNKVKEFSSNGLIEFNQNGEIKSISSENFTLTGAFKNNKLNGKGKWTSVDGSWHEGEFKNGIENGIGTLRQKDGLRYTGNFTNGLPNGKFKIQQWTLMGAAKDEWTAIYENGKLISSSQTQTGMTDFINGKYNNSISSETTKSENSTNSIIKEISKVSKFENEGEVSIMGTKTTKYFVKYEDGTIGYLYKYYQKDGGKWAVYDGLAKTWEYSTKEEAIIELYKYKN